MRDLLHDVRLAIRLLTRTPGSMIVAVTALAAGLGATAAVTSVSYSLFAAPLPFADEERLMIVTERDRETGADWGVSFPAFVDWGSHATAFEEIGAWQQAQSTLESGGYPVRLDVALVSASFFQVLGVTAAHGRVLGAVDDRPGAPAVAVLGHALWLERFGGEAALVGSPIVLGGHPVEVVGIAPPGFTFPDRTEAWVSLEVYKSTRQASDRRVHVLGAVGRLRPAASASEAAGQLTSISAPAENRLVGGDAGHDVGVRPLRQALYGDFRLPLRVLYLASGLLLLIAGANLGTLMLARALARRREWATRAALGASRWRLFRLAAAEALVVALLAAAVALWATWLGVDLLVALNGDPRLATVTSSPIVIPFTVVVAALMAMVFGFVPVVGAGSSVVTPLAVLGRGTDERHGVRWRSVLVAGQIALTVVLLVTAGLLFTSFQRMLAVHPGFEPDGLLTLRVSTPPVEYDDPRDAAAFLTTLPRRLQGLPGVLSASAVSSPPVSGGDANGDITAEGVASLDARLTASFRRTLPGYFETMGIPLLLGRDFEPRDDGTGGPVVIVNESLARRLWPGQHPIGRRIKVGPPEDEPWLTVVGVVGDVRHLGLDVDANLATFEPLAQRPRAVMYMVVRTAGAPEAHVPSILAAVRAAEPRLAIDRVETMDARILASAAPRRFRAALVGSFAILGVILSGIGLFGALDFIVSRRLREIGIRLALGGRPADVVRLVVRQGLGLTAAGGLLGLLGGWAATRYTESVLFEVTATDGSVHLLVALVLIGVAIAACARPAWRATTVDPVIVLREE